jgi:hypothetical protein
VRGNAHAQSGERNVETQLWRHRKVRYVSTLHVIQTANEVFAYRWSFDLLSEPRVMIWDQVVMAWDRQKHARVPAVDPETGRDRIGMDRIYAP